MSTYHSFKKLFNGVYLEIEDLYLLEPFQIGYLPGWIPEREFATVIRAYPAIKRFLIKRNPAIEGFINTILSQNEPAESKSELAECCDKVVWTVADLIIYNKCPEVYDNLSFHQWDFEEITRISSLVGKIVVDGGAGTGRVALEAARSAKQVYAIEPVGRLRQFIREKASQLDLKNIFIMDGFLDAIPLPDEFADIFITSHALGWRLNKELLEIERVVRRGGIIIHCPGTAEGTEDDIHSVLISPDWGYQFSRYPEADGWKRKYWKWK